MCFRNMKSKNMKRMNMKKHEHEMREHEMDELRHEIEHEDEHKPSKTLKITPLTPHPNTHLHSTPLTRPSPENPSNHQIFKLTATYPNQSSHLQNPISPTSTHSISTHPHKAHQHIPQNFKPPNPKKQTHMQSISILTREKLGRWLAPLPTFPFPLISHVLHAGFRLQRCGEPRYCKLRDEESAWMYSKV